VRASLILGLVLGVASAACDSARPPEKAAAPEATVEPTADATVARSAEPAGEAAHGALRGEPEPEPEPEPPPTPQKIAIKEPPPEVIEAPPPPLPMREPIDLVERVDDAVEYAPRSRNGVPGGIPGGVAGPSAPQRAPDPNDKSVPAKLTGSSSWNCPFPAEADAEGVDDAVVTLQVSVSAEGKASGATVLSDPGHGFGRAARQCALARTYSPARDADGKPTAGKTPPIRVKFSR
jgi:periplasmic protein TonB